MTLQNIQNIRSTSLASIVDFVFPIFGRQI